MTPHPARPAYPDGYRPTRTVAELMEETDAAARADEREQVAAELDDLAAMCRDAGFTAPLRDVMAHLIDRDRRADAARAEVMSAMESSGSAYTQAFRAGLDLAR